MSHADWKSLAGSTPTGLEVSLRRLHIDDIDLCGQWINTPEFRQVLRVDYPVGFQEEKAWLDRVSGPLPTNPSELQLGICANGTLVGCCGLHGISQRHRHAEIGILIGDNSMRGQKIGMVVYKLLHQFAFGELNLEALCAHVYGHNEASQKLHDTTGYNLVGKVPRWYFKAEEYRDLLIYHLSREKWKSVR